MVNNLCVPVVLERYDEAAAARQQRLGISENLRSSVGLSSDPGLAPSVMRRLQSPSQYSLDEEPVQHELQSGEPVRLTSLAEVMGTVRLSIPDYKSEGGDGIFLWSKQNAGTVTDSTPKIQTKNGEIRLRVESVTGVYFTQTVTIFAHVWGVNYLDEEVSIGGSALQPRTRALIFDATHVAVEKGAEAGQGRSRRKQAKGKDHALNSIATSHPGMHQGRIGDLSVAVSVAYAPPPFDRTRIVAVAPAYIILNKTNRIYYAYGSVTPYDSDQSGTYDRG